MGAVKKLLPSEWNDLNSKDIVKFIVKHTGFEDEMKCENGYCISSGKFGVLKEMNEVKSIIESALMFGYKFEIHLKNGKVLKAGTEE